MCIVGHLAVKLACANSARTIRRSVGILVSKLADVLGRICSKILSDSLSL